MGTRRKKPGAHRASFQGGKQQARLASQVYGARKIAARHCTGGLRKESARIIKGLLVVGGELRTAQLRQALANVLIQAEELTTEFSFLRSTLARCEDRYVR